MSSTVHELDRDGDVVLILLSRSPPFAVWDEGGGFVATSTPRPPKVLASLQRLDLDECWGWGAFSSKRKKKKRSMQQSITVIEEPIPSSWRLEEDITMFWSLDRGTPPEPSTKEPPEPPADIRGARNPSPRDESDTGSEPSLDDNDVTTANKDPEIEVRMKLSSKHLILASTYFKKMLHDPWKEGIALASSSYTINATEWGIEAMLILMNIIHGRVRSVPRSISLDILAQIAVLVDYYDCHEVVELFSECWIRDLSHNLPDEYGRDLILWIAISWVFSQETLFEAMTEVAVKKSKGPLQTLGLPIPQRIVETIDSTRQELLDRMISGLHNLLLYSYDRTKCSFACSSILLGAIIRQMHSNDLLNPKPTKPFLGYSVMETTLIVQTFVSPDWSDLVSYDKHECTIATFLDPCVRRVVDSIAGRKLGEFKP